MGYREDFIRQIAPYVLRYAAMYGVKCPSAVIAQACHETGFGLGKGAEVKVYHHNYFGLKYRKNRVDCNSGYFSDGSYEEYEKGKLSLINTSWYAFASMDQGVLGYFQFLFDHTTRYQELKKISASHLYLVTIKELGYATGSNYAENCYKIVVQYGLFRYDMGYTDLELLQDEEEESKMRINIHAGHNPDGKVACGAIGLIKESTQARLVKSKAITLLREKGHVVHDCTCENGSSQNNVLARIVEKCNLNDVDLDVSIHFNAGRNDYAGDGKTGGTEVFVYDKSGAAYPAAQRIVDEIVKLGFANRGVKENTSFYVLRKTKAPAMLIECCFVDDADDVKLYNADLMAYAIVAGLTGRSINEVKGDRDIAPTTGAKVTPFKVKILADELNIRKGAGTDYDVVGVITNHGTYTITEVASNWGKLKSGAGWISISTKYVKYV